MVGSIGEVEKGFHCILYARIIKIHRKHGWAYLACKKYGNIAKQTDAEGLMSTPNLAKGFASSESESSSSGSGKRTIIDLDNYND
ncbi:hypothetical protein Tco_0466057 [Tanacetum coccineum]